MDKIKNVILRIFVILDLPKSALSAENLYLFEYNIYVLIYIVKPKPTKSTKIVIP